MRLPDVGAMYRDMGAACAGRLQCRECGDIRECSATDASGFLAHGWPKCCGYTMTLSKSKPAPRKRGKK